MKKLISSLVISLAFFTTLQATHIIGGYINVNCLGGNSYEIELRLYRDCNPGNAGFDGNAAIGLFDSAGTLISTIIAPRINIINIPATSPNPCLVPPSNICVEEGIFSTTVTLSSSSGGYWLAYQRCCRNASILNIVNPTNIGATFYAQIPDPGTYPCNSTPIFTKFPPIVICNMEAINYDHSATDFNGDSITYYLCTAMSGAGPGNPAPNPPSAPPYTPVPYQSPYSPSYPMASSPPLAININTGLLTGTPNVVGRFVVAICMDEYRNGVKIGHYRREFQFNTTSCTQNIIPAINSNANGQILSCDDYIVQFGNGTLNGTYYAWDFGDPNITTDTSTAFEPTWTYADTGTYTVRLIVNPGYVCADTAYATVIVYPILAPSFNDTGTHCAGSTIYFTNQTSNNYGIISYQKYFFGDGDSSSLNNPTHIYASPGSYNVQLIVHTDLGCIDTFSKSVIINSLPLLNMGSDSTICPGSSTTLSPSGNGTWSWSPGASLSCTTCQNPLASPLTTTVYTLNLTSFFGCTRTDSISVLVASLPSVNAGPDVILCNTGVTQFNATASDTSGIQSISWSPTSGLSSSTILNPFANPLTTTTYSLTVVNNHGCSNTDMITVYRNILSVNAGNDVSICSGLSTNLNAISSNTVSYSWLPTSGLSNPNIANPVASPGSTTTYTVTISDSANCSVMDSVTVTVNPLPIVDAGPDSSMCIGNSMNLQASGANTYVWDTNSSLSCTNCSNPIANPSVSTTYYVTGTDGNGCTARDSVTVTITTTPSIAITPDTAFCTGGSVQLNASGGVSYMWNPPATLSCAFCQNPVASPSSTTTYTVSVTDANGCSGTASVTVSVNSLPNISAGSDASICLGNNTVLQANGGVNYQWTPTNGLSNPNISNPTASPLLTTSYTVSGTDANGCQNTSSVNVTVNPLPVVTISPSTSICIGGSTNLTANGANTYQWLPTTGLSNSNISNPVASPLTSTTYTVTGTDANGCQNTATVTITVNPLPTVTSGTDTSICTGSSVVLQANGASSYQWTPTNGLSNPNISNPIASPLTSTTYTVTGTDANGCQNTATVNVTVDPLPVVTAGADASICIGSSTNLNASGAISYQWSPSGSLSASNISNPVASPSISTNYTVSGTDANGCTNTDEVNITVNPLPTIVLTPDTAICIGDQGSLQASGGSIFQWSPATGLSCTNCPNPIITPLSTIRYQVLVSDNNGCQNTDSVLVSVNPLPTITSSPGDTICVGQLSNLNALGGVSYSWLPNAGLNCTNCQSPTAAPVSTTIYTVTGTDANGCSNTSTTEIVTNPLPNINISPDISLCTGFSTGLSVSGGISYQWSPATGLSCTTCASPTAQPVSSTTYSVLVTDVNGCQNNDSVTVTIYSQLPITITSNSSICSGSNMQLTASGGSTYQWSPASGLSNPNIANPIASPTITTTYTVLVTDVNGCQNTDSVTVTVNPLPVVTSGADTSICINNNTQLSASGAVTYQWSPVTGLNNANISNPIASPATTTTYTVSGTDANGCQNSSQTTVTIWSLPPVSAGADQSYCSGGDAQLSASGASTYIWSPATALSDPAIANPQASPTSSTTYTVLGTDANGCQNTDDVIVTVFSLPVITTSGDINICENSSTNLSASGGVQYQWTPGTGLSNSNISNPVATPAQSTVYTVLVTDANGCQNTDSVLVGINPLPTITTSADDTICLGDNTQINAFGAISYVWTPAGNLTNPNIANPLASPPAKTSYTVVGTDANGCQNTASLVIDVNIPADPQAGPDADICPGDQIQLSASNGISYSWNPTLGLSNANIANPYASPGSPTSYTVTIVDANGCTNTGIVNIGLLTPPSVDAGIDITLYKGESTQLNGLGGSSYLWTPSIWLSDPNVANPLSTPLDTITYVLLVTDANGCQNTDSMTIYVLGVPTAIIPNGFTPNGDGLNDIFKVGHYENFILLKMQVFNRWGELIFESTDINSGWDGTVNGIEQPLGTYIYIIEGTDNKGAPIHKLGNITLLR